MNLHEMISNRILFFDGAIGTMLLEKGINPDIFANSKHKNIVKEIHKEYLHAGSDIISSNSFQINGFNTNRLEQEVSLAIDIAKSAIVESKLKDKFLAYSIGPLGQMLEPIGKLSFDAAYKKYAEIVRAVAKHKLDFVLFETFTDLYEAKIAVLALKENSDLPCIVTMTYENNNRTLTGGDVDCQVALLESLQVDIIGINCGSGPENMISIVERMSEISETPILVQANAGIPTLVDGKALYDVNYDSYLSNVEKIIQKGANIIGACCGTSPKLIQSLVSNFKNTPAKRIEEKNFSVCSSRSRAVYLKNEAIIVGERINPSGKPSLENAIKNDLHSYIENEAIEQVNAGADILDINVGLADIDEIETLKNVVQSVQSSTDSPLQIDSSNPNAIEKALRYYCGKAIINSVSASEKSMNEIFPIAKKYGSLLIGLCMDENGLAETAEKKLELAKVIVDRAMAFGIKKKNIIIDPVNLSIGTSQAAAMETIKALRLIKNDLKVSTSLGISNISFGMPYRELINQSFLTLSLEAGLDLCIADPLSPEIMNAFNAFKLIKNLDKDSVNFIRIYNKSFKNKDSTEAASLYDLILNGIEKGLPEKIEELLLSMNAKEIIDNMIIPALSTLGKRYENSEIFLPQLIKSSEIAKKSFALLELHFDSASYKKSKTMKILIATVFEDFHDIGKDLVATMLSNYGYDVIDLGTNANPRYISEKVLEENPSVLVLSTLMTNTIKYMEQTIKEVKKVSKCKIMVGGAVLNEEIANRIGADFYAKDAIASVNYLETLRL